MAWYHKVPAPKLPATDKRARMEGMWIKCDACGQIVYKQEVERYLEVCPKCAEHFPLPVRRRLDLVLDPGSFVEYDRGLESTDPLQFSDSKKYKDRLKSSAKTAGEQEAFVGGMGRLAGREVSIGAFDFGFLGGWGGFAPPCASLGDIIVAEPKALIGFAGPRVIEQTLRQKLPEGFQTSEFLLQHGMIDAIVHRKEMRDRLAQLLGLLA